MPSRPSCDGHRRLHAVPRGLLRLVIARLLESRELSGIDIIRNLEERSGGAWKPSPGSIYPLLAQMEADGYIETVRIEGRSKTYRLSDEGQELLIRIRGHKALLLQKMQIGPLFWLGLLDPVDQAMAYLDMVSIAFERLNLIRPDLKARQKGRIIKRLHEIKIELHEIIEDMEHGGTIK
ncbi:MAG: PadR family transcriptional regulator [Candidatus Thorarchaeota archaeon]|nr:PadR family transcriptional regulator [Candidatus Thorarchaeota archaeon]